MSVKQEIEPVALGSPFSHTFTSLPSPLVSATLTVGNANGSVPVDSLALTITGGDTASGPLTGLTGAGNYAGYLGGTLADGSPLEYYFLLAYGTTSSAASVSIFDPSLAPGENPFGLGTDLLKLVMTAGAPLTCLDPDSSVLVAGAHTFLYVEVTGSDAASGESVDMTLCPVQMAVRRGGVPADGDWQAAAWLARTASGTRQTFATLLLTGDLLAGLLPGSYRVYVRVPLQDGGETAILRAAGSLIVAG